MKTRWLSLMVGVLWTCASFAQTRTYAGPFSTNDAHWLSDVVAGAVIGTATGRLVVGTNERSRAEWALRPVWEGKRRRVMVTVALPSK